MSHFFSDYTVATSDFDEPSVIFTGDPQAHVEAIARGKANALAPKIDANAVLVTADTMVYCNGRAYGKPENYEEAAQMLGEIMGKWHDVWTGLCVWADGTLLTGASQTRVKLRTLTQDQVHAYVRAVHSLDKAAAYAIQGVGSLLIEGIEGCYYSVMGLPIQSLESLLGRVGISVWEKVHACRSQQVGS